VLIAIAAKLIDLPPAHNAGTEPVA